MILSLEKSLLYMTTAEVLFAEEQSMSDKEWLCFDRAFNYSNESYKYCKRPSDYGLCFCDK